MNKSIYSLPKSTELTDWDNRMKEKRLLSKLIIVKGKIKIVPVDEN